MNGPERRQTARTTVEKFVYINILPSNGGSVLNVSEGGICFHSIAPIQANRTIRFWFWEHNRRIEVEGDLAWTDEARKTGGVRFTPLPAEAREPIRNWITSATTQFSTDSVSTPPVSPLRGFPPVSADRPETNLASGISEPLAKISPSIPPAMSLPISSAFSTAVSVLTKIRVPRVLRGFSGGLTTGLVISALVTTAFLFHGYRRQLGETLIHWGEQLVTKSQAQVQQPASPVLPVSDPPAILPERRMVSPSPAPIPIRPPDKLPAPIVTQTVDSRREKPEAARPTNVQQTSVQQAKPEPAKSATSSPTPAVASAPKTSVDSAIAATSPPTHSASSPTATVAPSSNSTDAKLRSIPKPEVEIHRGVQPEHVRDETAGSIPGIYLEVGKFKEAVEADRMRDKLAQLGFHATVVQKGRLWMNSYFVLVGPYGDDKAEGARKNLGFHGFKTRAFETGSRTLMLYGGCDTMSRLLRSGLTPTRIDTVVEDCLISWESYSARAIVKFVREKSVVATADGRWVNRGLRFEHDAFVYRKNDDGSQTLVEIQFAGMSQALVFDKSS